MGAQPHYYLISTAGYPNFGDEFITASWLRFLAQTAPNTDVWLDCPGPGNAQLLFEGLHPRLRITDTLWRAVREADPLPLRDAGRRVADLVRNLGSPHYDLGLVKLRQAHSLHLLGGGYVNGIWPHHTALISGMLAVKELTGARLYATGQGLMPPVETGPGAAALFAGFDHARARDRESAEAYELDLDLDDAFLGVRESTAHSPGVPGGVYVCLQSDLTDDARFARIVASVRDLVQAEAARGRAVHYLEAIPGIDRPAWEQLSDLIPAENFLPFARVWEEGLPLGPEQLWLTTRFHFHLLASAAGARGIAYAVNQGYYDIKHSSLIALGSGWALDTPDAPVRAVPEPEVLTLHSRLADLTGQKRAEALALYPPAVSTAGRTTTGPLQRLAASLRRR